MAAPLRGASQVATACRELHGSVAEHLLASAALVGLSNTTGAIDVQFGSGRVKGLGTDRVPVTPLQFHYHSPSEHTINGEQPCTRPG